MSLDCYHERNLSNSSEFGMNLWMERHPPSRQTPVVQGSSKLSLYHLILVITLSTKVCGRVGHCRICLWHHRRARNQGYESSHNNRHCPSCCLTPRKQKEIFAYPMDLPSRWNRLRTGPKTGKYSNSHHPYHSYWTRPRCGLRELILMLVEVINGTNSLTSLCSGWRLVEFYWSVTQPLLIILHREKFNPLST